MSVDYYGWAVVYDDDHHLFAEQKPTLGRFYTMYHGTSVIDAPNIIQQGFRQSPDGMLGPGVYVSRNQKKAARYPLKAASTDRVVLKLRVNTGRVKRIDTDNHPMQKSWHSQGYDTAWVPPNCGMKAVPSGLEEDCVWDPSRVEVVDIAMAPNATIQAQLQGLIAQQQNHTSSVSTSPGTNATCRLCKKMMSSTHSLQQCWGCGETICTLMAKHFCQRSS